MSRGLGKVEKKILEYFNEQEETSITGLCHYIAGNIEKPGDDWPFRASYSDSLYKSALRAANTLEKKGYIESRKHSDRIMRVGEHGGISWYKLYSLKGKC